MTSPKARRGRSGEAQSVAWRRVVFVSSTSAVAIVTAIPATSHWHSSLSQWAQFWLLASFAAVTVFAGGRLRKPVLDTATVFLVAAAIALPVGFAPFVAIPACVVAALWRHATPFLFLHQVCAAALATVAAAEVAHTMHDAPTATRAALLVAAALAFCATAGGLNAAFAGLARSRRLRARTTEGIVNDLVFASLGVVLGSLWSADPWRIPLALAPLVLVHRLQRLPTLQQQAGTDAKTGLMNMHVFGEALDSAVARSRAEQRPLSLVVIDLDLLREINNEHGHLVGDAVIKGISDVLRQQIRKGDIAARFGGEEFMLALPDTPPDRALRIAERIREAVAGRVFKAEPLGPATRATLSAGVAAFPHDATSTKALIHAADVAVMAAKARGRNRVVEAAKVPSPSSRRDLRPVAK